MISSIGYLIANSHINSTASYWNKLPVLYGPLYGRALQIAIIIIPIAACIFTSYIALKNYINSKEWSNPSSITPNSITDVQMPNRIPEKIVISPLPPFDDFIAAHRPSSDTQHLIEIQPVDSKEFFSDTPIFDLPREILVQIISWLPAEDLKTLSSTSRIFHHFLLQYFPNRAHEQQTSDFIESNFIAVDETQFNIIPKNLQYLLFLLLCKHFNENFDISALRIIESKGFIAYLIRRLGPFTFLTIPLVANFQSPTTASIERCILDGQIHFRFYLKCRDNETCYTQEIAQGYDQKGNIIWKTSNQDGFWEAGQILTEDAVKQLLACLRNEPDNFTGQVGLHQNLGRKTHFVCLELANPSSV